MREIDWVMVAATFGMLAMYGLGRLVSLVKLHEGWRRLNVGRDLLRILGGRFREELEAMSGLEPLLREALASRDPKQCAAALAALDRMEEATHSRAEAEARVDEHATECGEG